MTSRSKHIGDEPRLDEARDRRITALALASFACVLALYFLWSDCLLSVVPEWKEDREPVVHSSSFDLVKYAASAPSASPILECFQVYQPVLTPSGATDDTLSSDGLENTTTIASASSGSSCELLLMEHSFAFSYGMPFVGLLRHYLLVTNVDPDRELHTAKLQVQSSGDELHGYF